VAARKNKWASDWASHWFYHKVMMDPTTKTHSLVVDIGDVPKAASHDRAEDEGLLALLRKLSKTFSTQGIIVEFVACDCFPVWSSWAVSN